MALVLHVLQLTLCATEHTYIFLAKLVYCAVHSTIRTPSYLFQDSVLVDGEVRTAVGIVAGIFGSRIERFLFMEIGCQRQTLDAED